MRFKELMVEATKWSGPANATLKHTVIAIKRGKQHWIPAVNNITVKVYWNVMETGEVRAKLEWDGAKQTFLFGSRKEFYQTFKTDAKI